MSMRRTRSRRAPVVGLAIVAISASSCLALATGQSDADGPVSTASMGARCIGPAFDDTPAFQAALDTGHTVYAPRLGGSCHFTSAVRLSTPNQTLYGDGIFRTRIEITRDFHGEAVFVGAGPPPGPILRDLSVSFEQPDTDDRQQLIRYGAAFSLKNLPGFQLAHIGCFRATVCVDMKGNTGRSTLDDLLYDAFDVGIDIDGALDTVRLIDTHWWPFELTARQQTIFLAQGIDRPIGLKVGRADDLKIVGGLFLGGLGTYFYQGKLGPAFGNIVATDFDGLSGIRMEAGVMTVASSTFTIGAADGKLIDLSGGALVIGSSHFHLGTKLKAEAIAVKAGALTVSSSFFELNAFDNEIVGCDERGVLTVAANVFHGAAVLGAKRPLLNVDRGCRHVVYGNVADVPFYDHRVFLSAPTTGGIARDNAIQGLQVRSKD